MKNKNKIVVILGPTTSGKTKLAVLLARQFNGEIVSADSRQVYRGLDIGTGKDLAEYILPPDKGGIRGVALLSNKPPLAPPCQGENNIPYHLIDIANPKRHFDLAKYQALALAAIDDILARGKLPLLVGGSGLYLQAVVDNFKLAEVKKDLVLRKKLEKLSAIDLLVKLKKIAPKMAVRLNQSDRNNKRRLIRYLEILEQDRNFKSRAGKRKYDALLIGLKCSPEDLKQRIGKRLIKRLKEQNLIGEVASLRQSGLSWQRLENFGLEYKFISLYLQKKIGYEEMVEKLNLAIVQFAKRQLTWFKRWEKQGTKINWLDDSSDAIKMAIKFIE